MDVVESPSQEVFKMWLDRVLGGLIEAVFPRKGWTRWSFEVLSSLGCSVILRFYDLLLPLKEIYGQLRTLRNCICGSSYFKNSNNIRKSCWIQLSNIVPCFQNPHFIVWYCFSQVILLNFCFCLLGSSLCTILSIPCYGLKIKQLVVLFLYYENAFVPGPRSSCNVHPSLKSIQALFSSIHCEKYWQFPLRITYSLSNPWVCLRGLQALWGYVLKNPSGHHSPLRQGNTVPQKMFFRRKWELEIEWNHT